MLLPLLQLLTDLGSGEFSGDGSYMVDKDVDHFQFHHEPLTWHDYQPLKLRRARQTTKRLDLVSREKGFLPRQHIKRARDTMDNATLDVARGYTEISHFLGLETFRQSCLWLHQSKRKIHKVQNCMVDFT